MKKDYLEFFLLFLFSGIADSCTQASDEEKQPTPENNEMIVAFPTDFTPEWATSVAGKDVTIANPLFVTQTYNGTKPEGTVIVSSEIKRAFVEVNRPSDTAYPVWIDKHDADKLILTANYSLAEDVSNTLCIGSELKGIKGKVTYGTSGYCITLTDKPTVTFPSCRPYCE